MMRELTENKRFCAMYLAIVAAIVANVLVTGCQQMKNAWQSPAPYKSAYGPTPQQRVAGMRELAKRAATMTENEAAQTCDELSQALAQEQDPHLRQAIVRTLGAMPGRYADEALTSAMKDNLTSVRIAACESWARRPNGKISAAVLHERLIEDKNVDVRLAAIRGLQQVRTAESTSLLASALQDRDPAVQLAVTSALQDITGQNFGNDVAKWQQYLASRTPAQKTSPNAEKTIKLATGATSSTSR